MDNKVQFDIDQIHFVIDCFSDVAKESNDAISLFSKIVSENESELLSYIKETNETINKIEAVIRNIESKIVVLNNMIKHYTDLRNNCKNEEDQKRYDRIISNCKEAIYKLEGLINTLKYLMSNLISRKNTINQAVLNNISSLKNIEKSNELIADTLVSYGNAINEVKDKARMVDEFKASSIKGYTMIDREFVIKNTKNGFSSSFSSSNYGSHFKETKRLKGDSSRNDDEIVIKEKDQSSFIEQVNNCLRFKMPSSILHKLGGQNFITKMNSLGYSIIVLEGDTIIDSKGMIHWEKKND